MFTLNVKWGKEKYAVSVNTEDPPICFKAQLFDLTGVPPERQKVLIKGKTLPDESWSGISLCEGLTIMMMGSTAAIPKPPAQDEEMQSIEEKKEIMLPGGLKNLGNTCYMNAVVQSMKTMPVLRQALDQANEQMAPLVRSLSKTMKETDDRNSKGAKPLLLWMGLLEKFPQFGSMTANNVNEQQDANECYTQLLHYLLENLGEVQTPEGKTASVKRFFRGTMNVELKNMESETEPVETGVEEFTQLSCFLTQDVKYIQSGIRDKMNEEIEKFSPALDRNAKFSRKTTLSRLPAYISVQMVRFFYKENSKTNAKILKDVKFPLTLDVFELCSKELQQRLLPQREAFKVEDDAKLEKLRLKKLSDKPEAEQGTEDKGEALPYSFEDDPGSNNSGFYELSAVITHKGRDATSGHYVAWVRLQGDKWAMCDDYDVHPVTADQVLKLSGGGDWHTAYVLVYGPRICHKHSPEVASPTNEENKVTEENNAMIQN